MNEWWSQILSMLLHYAPRLLGAAIMLVVGWLALRFLVGPLRKFLQRARLDSTVVSFLVNSARTTLFVVIILGVLQQLGIETTSLLALAAAMGLAVALSLQNSLANFASGLLLLSFRLVRVGDTIELGDIRGQVVEMLPFHVVLITLDNQRVTIPNLALTNGPVRNHTVLATRRVQWTLPLNQRDNATAVKEALKICLLADPRIMNEPPPHMFFQDWADDKRVLVVQAWVATENLLAVQQEMLEQLGLAKVRNREAGEKVRMEDRE